MALARLSNALDINIYIYRQRDYGFSKTLKQLRKDGVSFFRQRDYGFSKTLKRCSVNGTH